MSKGPLTTAGKANRKKRQKTIASNVKVLSQPSMAKKKQVQRKITGLKETALKGATPEARTNAVRALTRTIHPVASTGNFMAIPIVRQMLLTDPSPANRKAAAYFFRSINFKKKRLPFRRIKSTLEILRGALKKETNQNVRTHLLICIKDIEIRANPPKKSGVVISGTMRKGDSFVLNLSTGGEVTSSRVVRSGNKGADEDNRYSSAELRGLGIPKEKIGELGHEDFTNMMTGLGAEIEAEKARKKKKR